MLGRITVVEQITHHSGPMEQPTSQGKPYARDLDSSEERYERRIKVGGSWKKLDCGWIEEASLLRLANEPPKRMTIPSAEEKLNDSMQIVELVSVSDPSDLAASLVPLLIYPKESCRIT